MQEMESALSTIISGPILKSRLMETEPIDVSRPQDWYLNRIMAGTFDGSPRELLEYTQTIEIRLGRSEKGNRTPRTADIDILLFDNLFVNEEDLIIPHPALVSRRFCIEGLFEILPSFTICVRGISVAELYRNMDDEVRKQKIKFL
jgi:2-amino-4-hydroxy-6-hydroxymethyldihydropteridine diphosphokinase